MTHRLENGRKASRGITQTVFRAFATLGLAAGLATIPDRAHALLLFTIKQVGNDVVVTGKSIDIVDTSQLNPAAVQDFNNILLLDPYYGQLGTGKGRIYPTDTTPANLVTLKGYSLTTGPTSLGTIGSGFAFGISDDSASQSIYLDANASVLYLPADYTTNHQTIDSTTTFPGITLQDLGFTQNTYNWTWGTGSPDETFQIQIEAVPAPLPALGGVTAFGWSRRLRRRVRSAKLKSLTEARA